MNFIIWWIIFSFLVPEKKLNIPITNYNIFKTDRAIYVESDQGSFKLDKLSDTTILKAKKIYIKISKNAWGITLVDRKELTWE